MEKILEVLNSEFEHMNISYEYLEWTQPVTYPYAVGEYGEYEPMNEDGEEEKTFTLTMFDRGQGARLRLEQLKSKIEQEFNAHSGKRFVLADRSVLIVFYSTGFSIPSGEEDLYKMQINLSLRFWKVR